MHEPRHRLLTRVVAPLDEPITPEEAKLYLRVTDDEEDLLIQDLIVGARMTAEQWLKRSLMTQSWKLAYDDYVTECVALPMGPVSSITSVTVVNRDTTTQTISSALYYLNAAKDAIMFDSPVVGFRIEIVYVTGYGGITAVPRPIKSGMLAHVAAMFDNRGETAMDTLPAQSINLYAPYREVTL